MDGKSPNIWDNLTHEQPRLIADRTNGDIAADSYHFYMEDVKALKYAGVNILTIYNHFCCLGLFWNPR